MCNRPHVRRETTSSDGTSPDRTWGQLRHGNRGGDLTKIAPCGARTRAGGACRQPAMRNGRCRLHGGKSTGPRTPEGLARSRTARLRHGIYAAEYVNLKRAARIACRRLDVCIAAARQVLADSKNRGSTPCPARPSDAALERQEAHDDRRSAAQVCAASTPSSCSSRLHGPSQRRRRSDVEIARSTPCPARVGRRSSGSDLVHATKGDRLSVPFSRAPPYAPSSCSDRSEALPPAAVVSMVSVRSVAKRCR